MSDVRGLRPQPLLALAALCAVVLLAVLALEVRAAGHRQSRLLGGAGPAPAPGAQIAQGTLSPGPVADWTRIVLARPLFSPGRRPPSVATAGPERPRLAGIILAPGEHRAIFAGSGTARGIVAAVGQQAGAWHVLAIDATGVRVMGPDGARTLHPSRDTQAASAEADAPPLPEHPSILDMLRNRNLQNPGAAPQMPILPPTLRNLMQTPQQPAPASPE